MNYESAPEVEEIAKSVIAEHFEEIENLQEQGSLKIAYLWRPWHQNMGEGRVVAGCCVHVDDRNHALHGFDFMIVIARDLWDGATAVNPEYQKALVHHELKHVGIRYDKDGAIKVDDTSGRIIGFCRHHDIEEFEEVLSVYGAWHGELRKFLIAWNRDGSED